MTQIQPLTMREVLALHDILSDYLPETASEEMDMLEYTHQIIRNIIDDKNPSAFIKALGLMSKKDFNGILRMKDNDRTALFVECVFSNRLWMLNPLLRNIGYGASGR